MSLLAIENQALVDPARGRRVATRVYAPAATGRHPVVIFSHGFSSDLNSFTNTARYWAEHGYVVLHPTHADSINFPDETVDPAEADTIRRTIAGRATGVDEETRKKFVRALDNPFYLNSRLKDLSFIVRCLQGEGTLDERVVARADLGRLAIAGHSYGAYTALVVAGARLTRDCEAIRDPLLRKFSAALAVSAQGAGRMSLSNASFAGIRVPLFSITGSKDIGAAGETPEWRQQGFRDSPPGDRFAADVSGFGHVDFDPPEGDPVRGAQGDELRRMQLEFLDGFVVGRTEARQSLLARARASKPTDPIFVQAR